MPKPTAFPIPSRRGAIGALVVIMLLAGLRPASAFPRDPEQKCFKSLYFAWSKYVSCQQRVFGRYFVNAVLAIDEPLAKCRVKYTDTWLRILREAYYTTSTCFGPRFIDNGDGTVTDQLTRLRWEKKTEDGTVHDGDNTYVWGTPPGDFYATTGTVFTEFLRELNSGSCFAGHCDWRLPTIYELQTIIWDYPCADGEDVACIDQAAFGPTPAALYRSATAKGPYISLWQVWFRFGGRLGFSEEADSPNQSSRVRAVRGGL